MLQLPSPRKCAEEIHGKGWALLSGVLGADKTQRLSTLAADIAGRSAARIRRGESGALLDYSVVTGEQLRRKAPALFALHQSLQLQEWIQIATRSTAIAPSPHLRSAVNINCMSTKGQAYPWHHDAAPYSAVLFLTSMPEDGGGELLIEGLDRCVTRIEPVAGQLLVFDGSRCAHAVSALRKDWLRLTLPMVFCAGQPERPEGLDDFLYGKRAALGLSAASPSI